jgi:hypothetical protein
MIIEFLSAFFPVWMDSLVAQGLALLVALGTGATAIGATWTFIIRPLVKFHRSIFKAALTIENIFPVLTTIANEFKANGGSSLKDSLNRIEHLANGAKTMAETSATAALVSKEAAQVALNTASDARDISADNQIKLSMALNSVQEALETAREASHISRQNHDMLQMLINRSPMNITVAKELEVQTVTAHTTPPPLRAVG